MRSKSAASWQARSVFALAVVIVCTSSSGSCLDEKERHQKFTDIWANQTTFGKQFGLSAIAMGKKLKELGLRTKDGNPTAQALCQSYCTPMPLKDGTPFLTRYCDRTM